MSGSLHLPAALRDEIVDHARLGYPEEVCGLIAGRQDAGCVLYRGRNVASAPRVGFELDTPTLLRLIELDEQGLDLVAVYHSHPAGPEEPSAVDVANSFYPQAAAIICSLSGVEPMLRAFSIVDGQVAEIEISIDNSGQSEYTCV
jgi:proteasome lid subunit RPN8/RPN11